MSSNLPAEPDPKYVPEEYVGKIEPNYYCRGWNEKRSKYCKARSGKGTDHVGQGRCKLHGGNKAIKSGRYSKIEREDLGEAVDAFLEDPELLDLSEEVAMLKALLRGAVNRHEELVEALMAWNEAETEEHDDHDKPGRPRLANLPHIDDYRSLITDLSLVVSRINKADSDSAISRRDLFRILTEMGRVVDLRVGDEKLKEQIKDDWLKIRLA